MPKSKDPFKDLQRLLGRLAKLDGVLVRTTEGPCLLQVEAVIDPKPLLVACQERGAPTRAALSQSLRCKEEPLLLSPRWLAAAARDLSILEKEPALLTLTKEAPRLFRKYEPLDRRWIAEKRARLEEITKALSQGEEREEKREERLTSHPSSPAPLSEEGPPWFPAVLALIRALHGEASAERLQNLIARSRALGQRQRRGARARVEALLKRLEGEEDTRKAPALKDFLDQAARRITEAGRLPARARRKKLCQIVWEVLFWPSPGKMPESAAHEGEDVSDIPRAVAEISRRLLKSLRSTNAPEHLARLYRVVSLYGLLFPCRDVAPRLLALSPSEISRALRQFAYLREELIEIPLAMEQVFGLLRLLPEKEMFAGDVRGLGGWLHAGLEWELLEKLAALDAIEDLKRLQGDVQAARAYGRWLIRLLPHYRSLGVTFDLGPETFARLRSAKDEELAILSRCLVEYHAGRSSASIERQIITLDATLALFQKLPERAQSCLASLSQIPTGLGRALFPEFADWLSDAPLLDRYVHLSKLAGETPTLSRNLLRDFSLRERQEKERRYLSSLKEPNERQKQTLAKLSRPETERALPTPNWTRRRLQERIEELWPKAYQRQLDEILKEILARVFKIQIPRMTPAWRDAVRFYLSTEQNHELLGVLLSQAALSPGAYIAPRLPRNRAFLEKLPAGINRDAWLSPRRHTVELDGKRYTLLLEEDPLLVLRMGIPFRTCLSLENGFNAASTVLNALDVNKRVIYLKSPEGSIVARKLIAISKEFRLIGYRLYSSLPPEQDAALSRAFFRFCEELSREAGLPLASTGKPEEIHPGFWYDDGTEPFSSEESPAVREYLEMLGLALPEEIPEDLRREVSGWHAQQKGDTEQAIFCFFPGQQGVFQAELGQWIVEQLGEAEVLRRLPSQDKLLPALLQHAVRRSPEEMLAFVGKQGRFHQNEDACYLLRGFLPSARLGRALAQAAARLMNAFPKFDDHHLEHATMYDLHRYAARMTPAELLEVCNIIGPVWDWVVENQPSCDVCRDGAEARLMRVGARAYARNPDPEAIIRCLKSSRQSRLAHQMALHLAARFPLQSEKKRFSLLDSMERGVTFSGPALRALQELRKQKPAFESSPDLLAALLRQGFTLRDKKNFAKLPVPTTPPFEALGDLVLHIPELSDFLERWALPAVEIGEWRPGPWERYYHRRHPGPLGKKLAREIEEETEHAREALNLLLNLGDAETLSALQRKVREKTPTRRHPFKQRRKPQTSPPPDWLSWDIALQIDDVVWQRSLDGRHPESPEILDEIEQRTPPKFFDPALLRCIFALLRRKIFEEGGSLECSGVERALEMLRAADLDLADHLELAGLLWEREKGTPGQVTRRYLGWLLRERVVYGYFEIPPEFLVRLWQDEALRPSVLTALELIQEDWHRYHARLMQAAREEKLPLEGFEEAWLATLLRRASIGALLTVGDRALLERLFQVALYQTSFDIWTSLYRELPDAASAALFLKYLAQMPQIPKEKLKSWCKRVHPRSAQETLNLFWMERFLAERHE